MSGLKEAGQDSIKVFSGLADNISSGVKAIGEAVIKYGKSSEEMKELNGQLDTLKDSCKKLSGEILSGMTEGVGSQLIPVAMDWVEQLFVGFSENGTEGLIDAMGEVIAEAANQAKELAPQLVAFAVEILSQLGEELVENAPVIADAFGEIVLAILEGIEDLVPGLTPLTAALAFLIENMDAVLAVIIPLTAAFAAWVAVLSIRTLIAEIKTEMNGLTLAQYAAETAQTLLNASFLASPITWVVMILAALVAGFIYLWNTCDGFREFWINLWNTIVSFVQNAWTFISAFITSIPEMIAYALGYITGIFIQWCIDMLLEAQKTGNSFLETVLLYFGSLPEKFAEWFMGIIDKAGEFVINMVAKAIEAGTEFKQKLFEAFSNIKEEIAEIGTNIVAGLLAGISNGWDWLQNQVNGLVNSLLQGVMDALGIHSPSRKFKYIGEMCVAGWEEGSEDLFNTDTMAKDINATLSVAKANIAGAQEAAGRGGYTQNVYVNKAVSTPDEVARAIRVESRYGLMGGVAFA